MTALVAYALGLVVALTAAIVVLAHRLDTDAHAQFLGDLRRDQDPAWLDRIDAKAARYVPGSGELTGY